MNAYKHQNLWQGCVGAWCPSQDRSRSEILTDFSGYNQHGTLTNMDPGTDWVASDGKVALDFDTDDQVVAIGPQRHIGGLVKVTICGWFWRASTSNMATFGFSTTNSQQFRMLQFTDSKIYCDIGAGTNSFNNIVCALIGWVHFALVYDGSEATSAARSAMYLNGVRQTVTTGGTPPTALATAANLGNFCIGRTTDASRQTTGKHDDIRLYNRALTASEVATLAMRRGIAYETRRRRSFFVSSSSQNINLTGIASSEAFGSVTFVTASTPGTPTTPWTNVQTIFGALVEKYPSVVVGFHHELTKLPRVSLSKNATTLVDLNTCFSRIEESQYEFTVYGLEFDEVYDKLLELEEIYDYSSFQHTNRFFMSMNWSQTSIREPEPGIFEGRLILDIVARKDLSNQYNLLDNTSGKNIPDCLRNRFLQYVKSSKLVPSSYADERYRRPYTIVPDIRANEFAVDTGGRIEQHAISFSSYANGLFEVEMINEDIMNVFDYCNFITPKRCLGLEWVSDTADEVEPGIWNGSVNYNIFLGKDIPNG